MPEIQAVTGTHSLPASLYTRQENQGSTLKTSAATHGITKMKEVFFLDQTGQLTHIHRPSSLELRQGEVFTTIVRGGRAPLCSPLSTFLTGSTEGFSQENGFRAETPAPR